MLTGMLAFLVLTAALGPGIARASLGADVFHAAFNEATATPQLIFTVHIPRPIQTVVFVPQAVSLRALASHVFSTAPQFTTASSDLTVPNVPKTLQIASAQAPTVEYYQDPVPVATDPPAVSRFDLDRRVNFVAHADASTDTTSITAGAAFNARLGNKVVGVDVSRSLAHFSNSNPTVNAGLTNDMIPAYIPPFSDISKNSVSAGFNVPVSRRMTANVQVDAQHYVGGMVPFDAYNTVVGMGLTYKMKGPGAISLVTKQYRYQDNLLPLNLTQTSTNLTFSVKF